MSQSAPPKTGGQEEGPNPLEIFFEKNRKWIIGFAVLLIGATAGHYGLDAIDASKRNTVWTEFNASTGLGKNFANKIDLQPMGQGMEKYQRQFDIYTVSARHAELISTLMKDVEGADQAKVEKQIQESKGTAHEPWLVWVAAAKAYSEARFDDARTMCNRLKSDFPKHYLCAESKFPPQVLKKKDEPEEKKDDKKAEKKKDGKKSSRKNDETEYEDPISGSPVDRLLAAITRDERFKKDHSEFFAGSVPDTKETVIIKIADLGEIEIGLYSKDAKKHVEEFKKNITSKFYKGMRIHQIKRARKDQENATTPVTVHLGHPNSKEADRPKWKDPIEAKDEDILEFEQNNLSFFPGMVAAEQEKDGKSSARRFFVAVNDCAGSFDGEYVIFGKVIRGMEILKEIAEGDFLNEAEDLAGVGTPLRDLLVESTELKTK